jgi:RecB family endonuclease NucS
LLNVDFGMGENLSLLAHEVYIPEINGRIDLLLRAEKSSLLIVVELKSEVATREHVGQLASYVGWYKKNPDKMPGQVKNVKGLLLARKFSPGAESALEACPDLESRIFELHVDIKKS